MVSGVSDLSDQPLSWENPSSYIFRYILDRLDIHHNALSSKNGRARQRKEPLLGRNGPCKCRSYHNELILHYWTTS